MAFSTRGFLSVLIVLAASTCHTVAAQARAAAVAGPAGAAAEAGPVKASAFAGASTAPKGTTCSSNVKISPWDAGHKFPNVVVCCGGSVDFQWSGVSSVWQTATAACPATFTEGPAAKMLFPASNGSGATAKSSYFAVPGNYWITSAVGGACGSGLKFLVQVPVESGTVCPAGTTTEVSNGPGSQAAAKGPPGGTSTSTGPGSAAAASGPPGTSFTATGPGRAFSSSG